MPALAVLDVLLTLPSIWLALFLRRAHIQLDVHLPPRSFPACLLISQPVPCVYRCMGIFCSTCRTSSFSFLNFPSFLLAHSMFLKASLKLYKPRCQPSFLIQYCLKNSVLANSSKTTSLSAINMEPILTSNTDFSHKMGVWENYFTPLENCKQM